MIATRNERIALHSIASRMCYTCNREAEEKIRDDIDRQAMYSRSTFSSRFEDRISYHPNLLLSQRISLYVVFPFSVVPREEHEEDDAILRVMRILHAMMKSHDRARRSIRGRLQLVY